MISWMIATVNIFNLLCIYGHFLHIMTPVPPPPENHYHINLIFLTSGKYSRITPKKLFYFFKISTIHQKYFNENFLQDHNITSSNYVISVDMRSAGSHLVPQLGQPAFTPKKGRPRAGPRQPQELVRMRARFWYRIWAGPGLHQNIGRPRAGPGPA